MYGNPEKQTVGGAVVSFLLRPCAFMGLVVFGRREGISSTFTSYKNWIGHSLEIEGIPEQKLVRKYLHCYGPASIDGFMDWLGCSSAQVERMWQTIIEEIEQYWVNAYPEIDTIENKLSVIEKCGYTSVVHFALDDKCWKDNYYQPILESSEEFLKKYDYADEVKEFVEAGKVEADLYFPFSERELLEQIKLAKIWSVVEFLDNNTDTLVADTLQEILTGLAEKLYLSTHL